MFNSEPRVDHLGRQEKAEGLPRRSASTAICAIQVK